MQNKRFGAFSSSTNPEDLALTVKGIFATIGAFIALPLTGKLLVWAGVNIDPKTIVELWTTVGMTLVTLVTTTATLYGALRKIFIAVYDKYKNKNI